MKKTTCVLIAVLATCGAVAAAVAAGGSGGDPTVTTTVQAKEPKSTGAGTTTEAETLTVDPGTVTVTDADEDDVEQIEAVVTHEVPGVDASQIEDIDVSGDQATAKLDDGGTVSLRQEAGDWSVERPSRDRQGGAREGGGRERQGGGAERETRSSG